MTFKPWSLSSSSNFLLDENICPWEKGKNLFQQFLHKVLNDLIPNGCSDCWLVFSPPPSVSHTLFKGVYWVKKKRMLMMQGSEL